MNRLLVAGLVSLTAALALSCGHARTVAVADLHLGDTRSYLHDDDGLKWFVRSVEDAAETSGGKLRELVIAGDGLELLIGDADDAYARMEAMLVALRRVRSLKRVVLIVGNHDRSVFRAVPHEGDRYNEPILAGTPFHEKLGEAAGRLELALVYPAYEIEAGKTAFHITHGHYFDPWQAPIFDDVDSIGEIESRNKPWMLAMEAGGKQQDLRGLMRIAYHLGQHARGLLGNLSGLIDPDQRPDVPEINAKTEARIGRYLRDVIGKTEDVVLVYGHNHGGSATATRIDPIPDDDDPGVPVYNVGPWVTNHKGGRSSIVVWVLDSKKGRAETVTVRVPEALDQRAQERAYRDAIHGHGHGSGHEDEGTEDPDG